MAIGMGAILTGLAAALPYLIDAQKKAFNYIKGLWDKHKYSESIKDIDEAKLKELLGDNYYPEAMQDLKEGSLKLKSSMSPQEAQQQAQYIKRFREQNARFSGKAVPQDAIEKGKIEGQNIFQPAETEQALKFREQMLEGLGPRMKNTLSQLENFQPNPLQVQAQQAYQQMLPQLQQEAFGPTPTASFPGAIARQNRMQQEAISPQTIQALVGLMPYAAQGAQKGYGLAKEYIPRGYQSAKTGVSRALQGLGLQ